VLPSCAGARFRILKVAVCVAVSVAVCVAVCVAAFIVMRGAVCVAVNVAVCVAVCVTAFVAVASCIALYFKHVTCVCLGYAKPQIFCYKHIATHHNTPATHTLQRTATHALKPQIFFVSSRCNTLQHTCTAFATHCDELQHTL